MADETFKKGDVVQFDPEIDNKSFGGCLAVVTEHERDANGATFPVACVMGPNAEHHFIAFRPDEVTRIGQCDWIVEIEWLPNLHKHS